MRSVACVRDDRQTATQRRYQPLHTVSVSVCLSLSLSLYLCVCVFVYLPVSAGMSISISLPPVPKCSLTIRLPVSVTFYFHFIPSPIGHSHFLPYYSISSQLLLFFMDTVKQITSKLTWRTLSNYVLSADRWVQPYKLNVNINTVTADTRRRDEWWWNSLFYRALKN